MDRTIHTQDSHLCRSGSYCRDATYGPHQTDDGWLAATTAHQNALCGRCVADVAAAIAGLWQDYLGLHRLFGEPSTGPASEIRSTSPTPQIPINVHTDALKTEIVDVVAKSAAAISCQLGADEARSCSFVGNVNLVEAHTAELLAARPHEIVMWNRAGDHREWRTVDGIDLALILARLHRRARNVLGVERPKDRLPVPCPKCEARRLVRYHGADGVTCESCLARWSDDGYRQLTMIGARLLRRGDRERKR